MRRRVIVGAELRLNKQLAAFVGKAPTGAAGVVPSDAVNFAVDGIDGDPLQ